MASSMDKTQSTTTNVKQRRIVQSFSLIWLDANIDESKGDFRNSLAHLRSTVNTINTFTNADQAINFLKELSNEKVLMIVSGSFGQSIIPSIHGISHLHSIFVFCGNKTHHEQWVKDWSKVKGVFTKIEPICESLRKAAQQCDHDSVSMSFVTADENFSSNQTLNQLDQCFMYTQLFKDILRDIKHDDVASIHEFTAYCREQYANNEKELARIAQFEQDYHRHTPIWWYTYDCFLYGMLNRALFTIEVDRILKLGFFIHDLLEDIVKLNSKQPGSHQRQPFIVYRGQGLPKAVFKKLRHTKGGLITFNNFLSTSKNEKVAIEFAHDALENPDLVGILFIMTINPMVSSAPFAFLDEVSHFKSENEVLFSMNTIFRIDETKRMDNNSRLWQVKLTLTADNDFQLSTLIARLREETSELSGWDRLGRLLLQMGEFDKHEQVYRSLVDQPSNDIARATTYMQLACAKKGCEEYIDAVIFCKKAIEIDEKLLPENHPTLASDYTEIAGLYDCMGEQAKAISFCEKALAINQKVLLPNHPHLPVYYDNIALLYNKMDECRKAIPFREKALEIRLKTLPPLHPQLSEDYRKIGEMYDSIGECSKAILFLEKSLTIDRQILSPNNPQLAIDYDNIGLVYRNMSEYSKALSSHQMALKIYQETLPPTHPSLIPSYTGIGCVYQQMGEYSKALSYYEKVFEINQKTLALNDPQLANDYIRIGSIYVIFGDYPRALSFYEKALQINQKSFPSDHLSLVSCYEAMGAVYDNMGEHSKALSFFNRSLEIRQKNLPPNHLDLGCSYLGIGWVCKNMGEYSKALSFYEKALKIMEKKFPPIHSELGNIYNNFGEVYSKIGDYTKALWFLDKAVDMDKKTLPPNHRNLAEAYNNLGDTYKHMGDYLKAFSFYKQAVEIGQRSLPPNQPDLQKWRKDLEEVRKQL